MSKPKPVQLESPLSRGRCRWRDRVAAFALFVASAAVVFWQNAHLAILWDTSYILDTGTRIAEGQMPYRDFPLAHAPLTFLIQAAIIRLAGRVYFHHFVYAAVLGGLGTVLAWRIVLGTLRGRLRAAWFISLILAAPLIVLGIYSILPFPFYDCDCVFCILVVIFLLQRVSEEQSGAPAPLRAQMRSFVAGGVIPLPLFFKQNIGLPLLAAALAMVLLLLRPKGARSRNGIAAPGAILSGAAATLIAAVLMLHFTVSIGNYLHWTIQFASQRRLPGIQQMLEVYTEPSLWWWLPCVTAAIVLLHSRFAPALWARMMALGFLTAPLLWTLTNLFLSAGADDRASDLLALWPPLLVLSAALTLWNLRRGLTVRTLLPVLLLITINGTLLSQQLWGSTYAIWPLLVILVAEMIAFLASIEPERAAQGTSLRKQFVAPVMAAFLSAIFIVCGGLYVASEERLSYARLEGEVAHSSVPALRGMSIPGPYMSNFEELLSFASKEIPADDGLILIPGEDPFYFATGRKPQFPVLLFDNATDPLSPAQLVDEVKRRNIRWLIVKRNLQLKEDPTPQREAALNALQQVFQLCQKLRGYDVYCRPPSVFK